MSTPVPARLSPKLARRRFKVRSFIYINISRGDVDISTTSGVSKTVKNVQNRAVSGNRGMRDRVGVRRWRYRVGSRLQTPTDD